MEPLVIGTLSIMVVAQWLWMWRESRIHTNTENVLAELTEVTENLVSALKP